MHGTFNWKILKCRWNRLHSASWLCNGAQVENRSGVICVWCTACLHRTAWAPKPLYCSCIGCLCGNGKCTEKWRGGGGNERTATYKYFSDINLYPNASLCAKRNRTLRHSLMNTLFLWKVAFSKYLFFKRRETKKNISRNPMNMGYRRTHTAVPSLYIRAYCSGGQLWAAVLLFIFF